MTAPVIDVLNRQRKFAVDCDRWRLFTEKALTVLPIKEAGASVTFVSDRKMRELNQQWRGKDATTDVLSFPAGEEEFERADHPNLGDVVISIEQAARQAKANKLTVNNEISQLILHGLIHLCGYDHETDNGQMDRMERRLRKRLGIAGE